ncbi:sodium- and chloride-dependent neutral and basic amino acid transporter B(0+) [Callorhinchus milii]|uniref:Transporter n=1 Tax=Callorhinchus milii TaxID=7868 RepID=A0A4W3HR96_CALMI|nr:sodium- and chloride-dependent neutral and basic amino acid transporter B(0+) [Callorhinchus milii]|eukprot:gi/632935555/ref/XP_007890458.1/ PREDICTED: sodium- and chloride-dependent neutral and basic amino acid transporter B [Callorhinchus milii]
MKKNKVSIAGLSDPPVDGQINETAARHSHVGENDENQERGNWSSKSEYLLSMIGYAVGLGNVWRFPYLAYRSGGGAFLIPYIIMLAFAGIPLFFLECSLGQFTSLGPTLVWKAVPILKGVGYTMICEVMFLCIYYNCIIGYSLYYLFAAFQYPLPWEDCFSWWGADEFCSKTQKEPLCNFTLDDGLFEIVNETWLQEMNETCINGTKIYPFQQSPSEQYWDKVTLRRSNSIAETGVVVWYLTLCLLLAWIIVALSMYKGIKSSGKVVYFTAIFPYVVLTIFLIRGVTLEGAAKGIEFYIGSQSDFSKLSNIEIWKDAATQIFFSLSVAWGGLMTLSSYNKFNNNCYMDAIIVCTVNCATSVFAGFTIFSILGHMAYRQDVPVSEVVQSGFGLAFIAYPEALLQLPQAPFWAILFFFMLVTLGLDSIFASVETITTSLQDEFPVLRSKRHYLSIVSCACLFLLGILCVTQAGIYWVNLIDHFVAGWSILIIAIMELIGMIWIYGGNRFIKDIEMMIGEKKWYFWIWWKACWFFISPCLLILVFIWSLVAFVPPKYGNVEYPIWAVALGWCMVIFCIIWIPIFAIVKIVQAEGSTLWKKIIACSRPSPDWGPYLEQHRGERYKMQSNSKEPVNSVQLHTIDNSVKL